LVRKMKILNHPINMTPKHYDVKRDFIFLIGGYHNVIWSHLGTLWASAWINDDEANLILTKWPNSIVLNPL
jgi:hypothetical protein